MVNQVPKKKLARFSLVLKILLVYIFYVPKTGLSKFFCTKGWSRLCFIKGEKLRSLVSLSVSLNGQIGSVFLMDFGGDTWQIVARFFQKMDLFGFFLGRSRTRWRWDWYHVKICERHDLRHFWGPDVLRVKCTSSSSTPSLSPGVPWLDLIGDTCLACHKLPQAATSCHVVDFTSCSTYLGPSQGYFALGMIFSTDLVSPISYQSYQKVIQKVTQKYGGVFIFLRILLDDHFRFWSKNQALARSQEKSIMSWSSACFDVTEGPENAQIYGAILGSKIGQICLSFDHCDYQSLYLWLSATISTIMFPWFWLSVRISIVSFYIFG